MHYLELPGVGAYDPIDIRVNKTFVHYAFEREVMDNADYCAESEF